MTSFSKMEMLDELRELIYQYGRCASFVLDRAAGYRLLFGAPPEDADDLNAFTDPTVSFSGFGQNLPLKRFPLAQTVEKFYDYGVLGIKCVSVGEVTTASEWTFAYGFLRDLSGSVLSYETLNGESVSAEKCLIAAKMFFARIVLDGGEHPLGEGGAPDGMLTIGDVALLAGLDDRTVRNATSKNSPNRLETASGESSVFIPRDAAIAWLRTKRGFSPTRIAEELLDPAALEHEFPSAEAAGDYVRRCRERRQFTPADVVAAVGNGLTEAALQDLEAGRILQEEALLASIGSALGIDHPLFALRLMEARYNEDAQALRRRILIARFSSGTAIDADRTDGERHGRAFSFVLNTGVEVFPVRMKQRDSGEAGFRVSLRGNTTADAETVDEETMARKVLKEGYAVRCASMDGNVTGLYKADQRAVREVKIHSTNELKKGD
jgi:hypothetical protein